MEKSYRRRKFFIKKDLQGKLILSCLLFIAGCGLLFNVILGILSLDSLSLSYTNQGLQPNDSPVLMLKQMITSNWFLIIVGGGCMLLAILLLSHRVAGPLYRFETTLDSMKKGHLDTTIKLRDKDEGKDLAKKINEFNSLISGSFQTISRNSNALHTLIEQAASLDLPPEEKEKLASLCWSMQEHNRKIYKNSSFFSGSSR